MAKGAILGQPARYNNNPVTLPDGSAGALQVDISNAVKVTNVLPAGSGSTRQGKKLGQPARYHAAPVTLEDGDAVALLIDENGNLIIS